MPSSMGRCRGPTRAASPHAQLASESDDAEEMRRAGPRMQRGGIVQSFYVRPEHFAVASTVPAPEDRSDQN